jgi:hypothetical protein
VVVFPQTGSEPPVVSIAVSSLPYLTYRILHFHFVFYYYIYIPHTRTAGIQARVSPISIYMGIYTIYCTIHTTYCMLYAIIYTICKVPVLPVLARFLRLSLLFIQPTNPPYCRALRILIPLGSFFRLFVVVSGVLPFILDTPRVTYTKDHHK